MRKNIKTNYGDFATLTLKAKQEIIFEKILILDEKINIYYGFYNTPFGDCIIGLYKDYICYLAFFYVKDNRDIATQELQKRWINANIIFDEFKISQIIPKLNLFFNNEYVEDGIKLIFKGTELQLKTWQELCTIPYGIRTSYSQVAHNLNSKAVRAVASAIANNPIAYLIPCHRVISKSGNINKYRWGIKIKER
ncbi:MAG TPA: methylated-DNA--[protein]-cysteine S-methyltransferase, partial [Burkholderiales bacterium]|nr:methylated-DNA--[protein]-cysteine S-methyltransferase [Burkholderiales bacterium]